MISSNMLIRPHGGSRRLLVLGVLASLVLAVQVVFAPPAFACHGMSTTTPVIEPGGFTLEARASTSGNGNTGWGYDLTAPAGRTVSVTWFAIDEFSASGNVIGAAEPTSHAAGEAMRFFVSGLQAGDSVTLEVFAFTGANGDCTGTMTSRLSRSQSVTIAAEGPSATTGSASGVSSTSATLAATAVVPTGASIVRRGIVFGEDPSPTVGGTGVSVLNAADALAGTFTLGASGLDPETTYIFRAFVESATGFAYGADEAFTTTTTTISVPREGPERRIVATAVEQAAATNHASALVVRETSIVGLQTSLDPTAGPRGGISVSDGEGLVVTLSTAVGVTPQQTLRVPKGEEVVCEICARLAADSVIEAWIYSEPRLAAAVRVALDGEDGACPLLRIPTGAPLDGGAALEPGAHTLQLRVYTDQGFEVVVVPFEVVAVPTAIPAGSGPRTVGSILLDVLLVSTVALVMLVGFGRPVALAAASLTPPRAQNGSASLPRVSAWRRTPRRGEKG